MKGKNGHYHDYISMTGKNGHYHDYISMKGKNGHYHDYISMTDTLRTTFPQVKFCPTLQKQEQ